MLLLYFVLSGDEAVEIQRFFEILLHYPNSKYPMKFSKIRNILCHKILRFQDFQVPLVVQHFQYLRVSIRSTIAIFAGIS